MNEDGINLNQQATEYLPSFCIGLVNYKTLDLTRICLDLLRKHIESGALPKERVQVWVVDNDSQDESTDFLRSLDWIHLIERKPEGPEQGFEAHGKGLDLILDAVNMDYLFLLHTDTFIYDPEVFDWMLSYCMADPHTAAVGCLEQLNRGYLRTAWRIFSRFLKYHSRRLKLALGLNAREPKPYLEQYLKSFCTLWNIRLVKQRDYKFLMAGRIPGYELQDKMRAEGFELKKLSPMKLFKYLDHVEAGTVGLRAAYSDMNRRVKRKKTILKKLEG